MIYDGMVLISESLPCSTPLRGIPTFMIRLIMVWTAAKKVTVILRNFEWARALTGDSRIKACCQSPDFCQ